METEKIYCCERPQDNSLLLAELMNAKNQGTDAATMSALFSRNNDINNSPFAYMVWMMAMRWMGGNWNGDCNGDNYNSRQIAQLQGTVNDNHNNDLAMQAISGSTQAVRDLATKIGCDANTIQLAISAVQNAITQVGGQVGMTGQQVINAVLMGNKDLTAALQNCCCENKLLVTQMGYEGQLRDQTNTCAITTRIDQLANGVTQGFSAVAYESARHTNDIIQAGNANTQRIIDTMNNHWQAELAQKYQDARLELSQQRQSADIIAALRPATATA